MKMILGNKSYGEYSEGKCFFLNYYKRHTLSGNSKTNIIAFEFCSLSTRAVCKCELPEGIVAGDRIILHVHTTRAGNRIVDKIEKHPSNEQSKIKE